MVQVHSPDSKKHKKRVSKACDCCRKSKTKCDGQRPCSRCLQDNKICTYMTTKKKVDKQYSSSYVDLLETRVSILVQSMTQLLEKSKNPIEISNFINNPTLYNDQDEVDMNKVICSLLSNEKIQNLSQSNHDYTIDEITNVTFPTSSTSSTPNTPIIPKKHHHSLQKDQEHSHIHKLPHPKHCKSPSTQNIDSLLYNDSIQTDLNTSDDTNSINSSIMSPVYSINETYDPLSNLQIQDQSTMDSLGPKLIDEPMMDNNYIFSWDQFDLNRVKDEFQLIPDSNGMRF